MIKHSEAVKSSTLHNKSVDKKGRKRQVGEKKKREAEDANYGGHEGRKVSDAMEVYNTKATTTMTTRTTTSQFPRG